MCKTISWIEDDHLEIADLVGVLERKGYKIPRYRTYQEAHEHLAEICQGEAIILDIILPSNDDDPYQGIKILREVREVNASMPVVVCTVVRNPKVKEILQDLNARILPKPIRATRLAEEVMDEIEKCFTHKPDTASS
jgi:DNA-binding NtrC family response regulator